MPRKLSFQWPPTDKKIGRAVSSYLNAGKPLSIPDRSGIIAELEDELANYFDVKYCLLTNSGTAALHSIYFSLGLGKESEVIVPTHTFRATASPLLMLGCTPIFCDSEYLTGNIDPQSIQEKITKKTRAIVVTHLYGCPAQMEEIVKLAHDNNIPLVEDAAQAFGAAYSGKKVGTLGVAGAFSLQENKMVFGGEGGFLITNEKEIYERSILLGHSGKRAKLEVKSSEKIFAEIGYGAKYRIHPLSALIANHQLQRTEDLLKQTRKNMTRLHDALSSHPSIELPSCQNKFAKRAYYSFPIRIKGATVNEMDRIRASFARSMIPQRDIGCKPLHLFPAIQKYMRMSLNRGPKISVAEDVYNRTIHLPPFYQKKDESRMDGLGKDVKQAVNQVVY